MSLRATAQSLWHVQRVKRLIRERMGNGVPGLVSVRETVCTDPGCEGPQTEIRIVTMSFQEIRATIHKAPSDLAETDIAALF